MSQLSTFDSAKNMEMWDTVYRTDPKYTKDFQRAGGFRGTAISPMYIVRKATEYFGPVGIGWKFGEIKNQTVSSEAGILWFSLVSVWYKHPTTGHEGLVEQWGGTVLSWKDKNGEWKHDDEAPKKAITDGLTKCLTYLGFGADIHLNDVSKYADHTKAERTVEKAESPSAKQFAKAAVEKHERFGKAMDKILSSKDTTELAQIAHQVNTYGFNDADLAELTAAIQQRSKELVLA